MFRNLTYSPNQPKKPYFLKHPKNKIKKSRKFKTYSTRRNNRVSMTDFPFYKLTSISALHKSWVREDSNFSHSVHKTTDKKQEKINQSSNDNNLNNSNNTTTSSKPKPVCKYFMRGQCYKNNCPYSHTVPEFKRPFCMRFIRGVCVDDNCPYLHVKVNPKAKVCPFFLKGRCPFGKNCKDKHVMVSKGHSLSYKRTSGNSKTISSSSSSISKDSHNDKVSSPSQDESIQIMPMFNTLPDSLN